MTGCCWTSPWTCGPPAPTRWPGGWWTPTTSRWARAGAAPPLAAGSGQIRLAFDGREIHDRNRPGPWRLVDVALSTATTPAALVHLEPSLGTTTAADPAKFEHPVVTVGDQFAEQLVDANTDCVYDKLRVAGSVTVETAGSYQVNARLVAADGTQVSAFNNTLSLTGTMPLWLDFPGAAIGASGKDGPYRVVDLHIYPVATPDFPQANPNAAATYLDVHTTAPYRPAQFTGSYCGQYQAVAPARIVSAHSVAANDTYTFSPLGQAGIPTEGVGAVAFQLSTRSTSSSGHLTVFPAGQALPGTSNVNYQPNKSTTDMVVSKLGSNGQLSIHNTGTAGTTTNLYVDVVGYYEAVGAAPTNGGGSTYVPLATPARIVNAAPVAPGDAGSITVAPLDQAGIPTSNVTGVVAQLIVRSTSSGYASVYPDGQTRPGTADVNFGSDNYPYANQVHATLGAGGRFRIRTSAAATVWVDVVGYFQAPPGPAAGRTLVALTPSRLVNNYTVAANGSPGDSYTLRPLGQAGVPTSGVSAVVFTLTAVSTTTSGTGNGGLVVYPAGSPSQTGSVYYPRGGAYPALQTARIGTNGQITIHNFGNVAARIYVDISGYYKT
jgi:hypothetical protein